MAKNLLFLLLLLILTSPGAYAFRDSIGNKVVGNMQYILHKVEKSEGLYAVSRRYNVEVADIQNANPGSETGLVLGQVLMVPYKTVTPSGQVKPGPTLPVETPEPVGRKVPVYYAVKQGETLYRIATSNKLTVAELQEMNNMKDAAIETGQQLIVGYKMETATASGTETSNSKVSVSGTQTVSTAVSNKSTGLSEDKTEKQYNDHQKILEEKRKEGLTEVKIIQEGGMAASIDDGSITTEKNLALHRTAPVGTLIRLTNPMNNKVVYVKVVGGLPENKLEENVVVKITKTAADFLGVRDQYFRVEQYYSIETIK